jgi:hypothetical protein
VGVDIFRRKIIDTSGGTTREMLMHLHLAAWANELYLFFLLWSAAVLLLQLRLAYTALFKTRDELGRFFASVSALVYAAPWLTAALAALHLYSVGWSLWDTTLRLATLHAASFAVTFWWVVPRANPAGSGALMAFGGGAGAEGEGGRGEASANSLAVVGHLTTAFHSREWTPRDQVRGNQLVSDVYHRKAGFIDATDRLRRFLDNPSAVVDTQ